jgi:CubicO group peptidase (beta-lactamase class C family)
MTGWTRRTTKPLWTPWRNRHVRITTKSLGGACRVKRGATIAALAVAGFAWTSMGTAQADPLLDEMVEFTGQIFFIESKVPAVVIGAVRNGEVSVRGFGERSGPGSAPPDGDTLLRLGSITKAFTGGMLAHLTAENTVQLTQPLTQWVPELAAGANGDVQGIRLIDLARCRVAYRYGSCGDQRRPKLLIFQCRRFGDTP